MSVNEHRHFLRVTLLAALGIAFCAFEAMQIEGRRAVIAMDYYRKDDFADDAVKFDRRG